MAFPALVSPGAQLAIPAGAALASPPVRPFALQSQQEDNWCWAAVALSVAQAYGNGHGLSQCDIATAALDPERCCQEPARSDPQRCNREADLETVLGLRQLDNLDQVQNRPLAFDELHQVIFGRGAFVAAHIQWRLGGGHYIVATNCVSTAQGEFVEICDPDKLGGPEPRLVSYESLVSNYKGKGSWTVSYVTRQRQAGA